MWKLYVSCGLLALGGWSGDARPAAAAVLYFENFSDQEGIGVTGPGTEFGLSTVEWTIDVSQTDLADSDDWFRVEDGMLEARDVGGPASWLSPLIDISAAAGEVSFSLLANETGRLETSDYYDVFYALDGGSFSLITNWMNAGWSGSELYGPHTLIGNRELGNPYPGGVTDLNDWVSTTITQSGLLGNTLQLRVDMNNSATSEYMMLDDVQVTAPGGLRTAGATVASAPEPSSAIAMMLLGVGGHLYRRRRRQSLRLADFGAS